MDGGKAPAVAGIEGLQKVKGFFPAYLPALADPYFQQPDPFYGGQKVGAFFATEKPWARKS